MVQHDRASPNINVFAQCPHERFMGISFSVKTLTGTSYLEMLQTWLFPRLQEDEPKDFIMQDGAPRISSTCSSLVVRSSAWIPDLKKRITAGEEAITPDLLIRVRQELNYRIDVCRVTKGAHILHL
jgi:hypothetical protein